MRALVADGISEREIAWRLGINRRTVARLVRSEEPPRYRRAPVTSKLDPFVPVLRRLLEEWPQIRAPRATELLRDEYGYDGSVDLVKRRLRELRPAARAAGAADRLPAGPGVAARLGGDADPADARRQRAPRLRAGGQPAVLGCADGVLLLVATHSRGTPPSHSKGAHVPLQKRLDRHLHKRPRLDRHRSILAIALGNR